MIEPQEYSLLDFGAGRKLERFGDLTVDRPSPPADDSIASTDEWALASAKYVRTSAEKGRWQPVDGLPPEWMIDCGPFRLRLKATPFGHLGVFPEQQSNWDWIAKQVKRGKDQPRVLNLFGYTGASTLAAAAAGAQVVHVDSAKNIVQWARQNAELSNLQESPIRWIVEDAPRFVARELKRGNSYDAVILDPPTYGHGPKSSTWRLSRDLMPLLRDCAALTKENRLFVLLTCHSPGYGPAELSACLEDTFFGRCQSGAVARPLSIRAQDGRKLDAGVVARWPS